MAEIAGLSFISFEIIKVLFDRTESAVKKGEFEINMQNQTQINSENKSLFRTVFIIDINGKKNPFSLQVQAVGNFEIKGDITNDVRNTYFDISSPAILYPYLRAFISNITMQSGMSPIIIPPMNFAAKDTAKPKDTAKSKVTPKPKGNTKEKK